MAKSIKEIWEEIHKKDMKAEELAKEWLEKIRKFKIEYWHENKPSNKYFDILASKGKERWIIEVKSQKEPPIKIGNIIKMIETPRINKVGLIFVPSENEMPILFELNKMSYAGLKASKTKGKEVEKRAARKAWISRRKK